MADDLEPWRSGLRAREHREEHEVRYWTEVGVSAAQLAAAVRKVGVSADAVAKQMGSLEHLDGPRRPGTAAALRQRGLEVQVMAPNRQPIGEDTWAGAWAARQAGPPTSARSHIPSR